MGPRGAPPQQRQVGADAPRVALRRRARQPAPAALGLADELEVLGRVDELARHFAEHQRVVDDEDADCLGHLHGCGR